MKNSLLNAMVAMAVVAAMPAVKTASAEEKKASPEVAEEIILDDGLVVEGRVEKPQVQFTLVKEPPPQRDVVFNEDFREEILFSERDDPRMPSTQRSRNDKAGAPTP